ncbi:hypothetical protein [Mycolicibacterium austroafricanum]|uniref:hypothetical protein n=1 Tax=Mycolicibacterium austroafricanum TaxID=39687 RepID=UPI001CA3733A|nr:hypothetical protein [Mycolicibacterium austroafricanum]QZT60446.1 hypothetical protein JN085_15405 [Mycolicibacterium austroafricanum]
MSTNHPEIESLGDHNYVVRVAQDGVLTTIQVRANPEVVARIAGSDADEARVVVATVAYLIARQRPDDLPEELDLDDVDAAYDGYVDELQIEFMRPMNA